MRRFLITLGCAAAFLFPDLAGAQTLRIGLREDPDILDPTLARTYVGRIVFTGLCDKLFDINEKLEIVPQLATGHEWIDPKTLVLKLRDGVRFHDGEPFDAEAVKYGLERHMTMQGSYRRSELNAVDRIEVVDKLTVRIVLKQPNSPFLAQLTDRSGMIVSPKAAKAAGKDFGLNPVCTGPFRFVERVAQDRIVLERFADYWDKDRVKLDRVVYRPMVNATARLAALQANGVEIVEQILASDADAVRKDPRLRLVTSDELGYQGITINTKNGPRADTPLGRDARVRKAFELSLDREALNQVVYAGLYTPTAQAIAPSSQYYVEAYKPPARDLARAKALLKEAGVTLPVPVTLTAATNPDIRQVAEVIQSMAGEAGFDVKIQVTEFAASLAASARGDFEAYILAWSGRVDPDGNLYTFLHSTGPSNDGKYSNPKVDQLLDRARAVTDVAERKALYAEMWTILGQDLPIIYLWNRKNVLGLSKRVEGFRAVPDNMIRLQGVSLAP